MCPAPSTRMTSAPGISAAHCSGTSLGISASSSPCRNVTGTASSPRRLRGSYRAWSAISWSMKTPESRIWRTVQSASAALASGRNQFGTMAASVPARSAASASSRSRICSPSPCEKKWTPASTRTMPPSLAGSARAASITKAPARDDPTSTGAGSASALRSSRMSLVMVAMVFPAAGRAERPQPRQSTVITRWSWTRSGSWPPQTRPLVPHPCRKTTGWPAPSSS